MWLFDCQTSSLWCLCSQISAINLASTMLILLIEMMDKTAKIRHGQIRHISNMDQLSISYYHPLVIHCIYKYEGCVWRTLIYIRYIMFKEGNCPVPRCQCWSEQALALQASHRPEVSWRILCGVSHPLVSSTMFLGTDPPPSLEGCNQLYGQIKNVLSQW